MPYRSVQQPYRSVPLFWKGGAYENYNAKIIHFL